MILFMYAMSFVGVPYRWGGDNPISGFDCSGLVIELLQSCGVLPFGFDTTAQGLYTYFASEHGTPALQNTFGALSFYGKSNKSITHVGFCIDEHRMIEAGGGDSNVRDRTAADAKCAFVRIRPIHFRKDYVATLMPNYRYEMG
jgi:cell wall-associated NlpC family hydrolase